MGSNCCSRSNKEALGANAATHTLGRTCLPGRSSMGNCYFLCQKIIYLSFCTVAGGEEEAAGANGCNTSN